MGQDSNPTHGAEGALPDALCSALREALDRAFAGCRDGCLHCGAVNELVAGLITEIEQIGSSSVIEKLEQAIVNIYRWTGSRRVARECQRVVPDVAARAMKPNLQLLIAAAILSCLSTDALCSAVTWVLALICARGV